MIEALSVNLGKIPKPDKRHFWQKSHLKSQKWNFQQITHLNTPEMYQIGVKMFARIPISETFDRHIKITEIYD